MPDQTHACPGCHTPGVPPHQLACKPCWGRLPRPFQTALVRAYRNRKTNPRAHSAALQASLGWYRTNEVTT